MTEPISTPPPAESTPPPAPPAPSGGGFFQNLLDLYFAPREAFGRILPRPTFLLPLVCHIALALAFTGVWLHNVDAREFMRSQLEESGQWDKIPPEGRETVMAGAGTQMRVFGLLGVVVVTPLSVLVLAGVFLFIYRFFYAGEVRFKQSLAVVAWTFFAIALVTTPLMLLVFQLKGDWNLNPQELLQANLGLLADKAETAKWLWALLTSLDLFTVWMVFLLAAGYGVACRKSTGQAAWGIVVPWLAYVVIKVGLTAIF